MRSCRVVCASSLGEDGRENTPGWAQGPERRSIFCFRSPTLPRAARETPTPGNTASQPLCAQCTALVIDSERSAAQASLRDSAALALRSIDVRVLIPLTRAPHFDCRRSSGSTSGKSSASTRLGCNVTHPQQPLTTTSRKRGASGWLQNRLQLILSSLCQIFALLSVIRQPSQDRDRGSGVTCLSLFVLRDHLSHFRRSNDTATQGLNTSS